MVKEAISLAPNSVDGKTLDYSSNIEGCLILSVALQHFDKSAEINLRLQDLLPNFVQVIVGNS